MIKVTDNRFWKNRTWSIPILEYKITSLTGRQWVHLFDQNGYRLTLLEQEYSQANSQLFVLHGDEKSLRKIWMQYDEVTSGPHLNHAFLFERKGYDGEALEQLHRLAKQNNITASSN